MTRTDLIKRYIKRRILLPVVQRLNLGENKTFTLVFNYFLNKFPFSESSRKRLRADFLPPEGTDSSTPDSPHRYQKTTVPIKLIQINGSLEKFAKSMQFKHTNPPLVSIVIPVYNQIEYTLCCLKSIAEHQPETTFEIIVVDDCSTDQTSELLNKIPGINLIRNHTNLNFLKSANKGASVAKGRFLLFLNNDTQVQDNWLEPMLEVFQNDNNTGLVGAKIVYPSGHLQEAGNRIDLQGNSVMIGLNDTPSASKYSYLREVDYCSGVAIMIEKDLFNKLDGFDELYAPCYYEDADLAYRVRKAGKNIFYQPSSVICHHLSVSTNDTNDTKMKNIQINREKFLNRWQKELEEANKVRVLAFYLPQFHTIPENDAWWGEGFTEWTNVKKAKPNFEGHVQPKVPGELGYYNLRDDAARIKQIDLAKQYGIDGFCYYYYWFNGKKLLETPLNMLLANKELDFPFCICWANEDWTRTWDGESKSILMKQEYSLDSYKKFIEDVYPLFLDQRYIKINDLPVLLIYRANRIKECKKALQIWREYSAQQGQKGLYIISVNSFGEALANNHHELGFDAIVEFPPHAFAKPFEGEVSITNDNFHGRLYDYKKTMEAFIHRDVSEKLFRCAMPSWDNTARRQDNPDIFIGSSTELYKKWMNENITYTKDFLVGDEKLSFVNAWNEWAEGNYLEPENSMSKNACQT